MSHQRDLRHAAARWTALVAAGAALVLAAACSSSEEKPIAPDGAAQQTTAPPYGQGTGPGMGQGPGMGMGPGMGRGPGMGMGPGMGRGPGMGPGMGRGPGMGPGAMCAMGSGPLADDVREAVLRALHDERRAEAAYTAVNAQLGPGTPFSRIERAEQRHSAALERVLTAHGVPIPEEKPAAAPPKYPDVAAACRAGVESEKANIAMYDGFDKIALPADVSCVFSHLRAASETRHLPVFQSCSGTPAP